jgi:hypothetical protein
MYGRVPSTYPFAEKQASTWRSYTFTFNNTTNLPTNDPEVLRQRAIGGGVASTPNLSLVSREIRTPETNMMSIGIGHQLRSDLAVNLDYVDQRSKNLYVNMAVNPQFPGSPRRLTSRFGNITLWDDFGEATFQALTAGVTLDRSVNDNQPLRASLAYTLGFYKSTFENFGAWVDQSYFNMQPSSGDERHRLVLSGMTPLPFGFELSGVAIAASPSRFVAIEGADINRNGLTNDDFINADERAVRPDGGWDVWYRTVDLRLAKLLPIPGGDATLSVEIFNLFNTNNWSGYGGTRTNITGTTPLATYRQPTGAYAPRQLQVGVRYKF